MSINPIITGLEKAVNLNCAMLRIICCRPSNGSCVSGLVSQGGWMILVEFRRLLRSSSVGIEKVNAEKRKDTGAGSACTGVESRESMCLAVQDELTESVVCEVRRQ